ncbi:MAG: hypothetical protein J6T54_02565 [Fibrobacter sp.]|nr:hypothetical protein [Fibrobacter sp.]
MKRLITSILLVGGLLAGCGEDSSSEPQNEPTQNDEKGKDEKGSKSDSLATSDSLSTADSITLFKKDKFTLITAHSKWTEASILELNSALDLTGREFMVKAECDSCDFLFKNLKLQSPYALLKVEKRTSNTVPEMSFIDLSRIDTAYVNLLTLFESKRILKLMKDGLPADSAERKAQQEVLNDLLGETFDIKLSNQISRNDKDSLTQNIVKAFSIGNIYYHTGLESLFEETGKWEKDSLKLIFADYAARFFGYLYNNEEPKPERKIGSRIYGLIYGFGICDSKNIDSVKVNADSSSENFKEAFLCSEEYGWHIPSIYFSNTYGWEPGYDGEIRPGNADDFFSYAYDSIQGKWISPSIQNGIACVTSILGKVIITSDSLVGFYSMPYRICEDLGYQLFWNTATKEQYYSQGIDCDSAYTRRPSLIDSTVQVLCYEGKYTVIMPTEPDEPKEETLLDKEAKLISCGEDEESFHKGQIDTTIYYYCYKGDVAVANEFDMIMGHGCHAEHKGYYTYQNSIYNCNGFSWRFASDSLVTGTVEDERDGTVYGTIGIGDQIWLSENMSLAIDSSWCPEDSLANCNNFGRLYRWDVILGENAQVDNICPEGFRIPTNEEFEKLEKFGKTWFKNKRDTQIFQTNNFRPGEDLLGFSLYLAGSRNLNGNYNGWRSSTNLCSQDHSDADSTAYVYRLSSDNSGDFILTKQKQYLSCSVRCIKD